jgi:predicted  nucleic acid-binding Zn-ribbon protein
MGGKNLMNCTRCGKEIPDGENKLCEDCQKSLLAELNSEESEESKFEVAKNESRKAKKEKETQKEKKSKKEKDSKKVKKEKGSKEEVKEETSKKSNKKTIIILAIIVLVLAILVVLQLTTNIFSNLFLKNNTVGNSIGNVRNYGYAATEKNWIYFVSPNDDSSKIRINKIKKDGSNKQVLFEEEVDVLSLNVVDGYIYFITISSSGTALSEALASDDEDVNLDYADNKICKMKTDGSDYQVINDNNFSNDDYEIYVIEDKVYYIGEDYNIYSMDTNGENITQINKNKTGFLGISDKYILFNDYPENTAEEDEDSTDYITYVMNLDGSNIRPVCSERLLSITLDGDYIYYTDSDKNICKIKVDGTEQKQILETSAYNMNLSGDYIYYMNYKDEENDDYTVCIFRVKKDGTNNEIVKELNTYSSFLDVVGTQVFYMDSLDNAGVINLIDAKTLEEIELYSISYESTSYDSSSYDVSQTVDESTEEVTNSVETEE